MSDNSFSADAAVEASPEDVAEQQQDIVAEPEDEEHPVPAGAAEPPIEADPADVAEQSEVVRFAEDEPTDLDPD